MSEEVGQTEYADGLHAFRRARSCEGCGDTFFTLELNEATLVQQEKILDAIKKAVAKLK